MDAHATGVLVHCSAAETKFPRTLFPNHETNESGKHQARCTPRQQTVALGKRGKEIVDHVNSRRSTVKQSDSTNEQRQQSTGSVSRIVKSGNRVVFDMAGSFIENKMTKDTV